MDTGSARLVEGKGIRRWSEHPSAIVIETQARFYSDMDDSWRASDVVFHVEELSIDLDLVLSADEREGRVDSMDHTSMSRR
jgi:hypothetical protein